MTRKGETRSRCRVSLTPEAWAYTAILALITGGAILREINLLIILAGLMIGPLLVSWKLVRGTLAGVEVRRRVPRAVHAGQPLVVQIIVTNRRRRLDSWALLVQDRCQMRSRGTTDADRSSADAARTNLFFPHVPAGQTRQLTYTGSFRRRGHYQLGPIGVWTRIPFGLVRGTIRISRQDKLVVYPRLGSLTRRWHETIHARQSGVQTGQRRAGAMSGEFHGLRAWRSGDSRRWIHWRSSAKRAELLVKQFEQGRHQDLILVVNLASADPDRWITDDPASPLEKAVSFAATLLAQHVDRAQGRVVLATAADPVHTLCGPPSPALLRQAWELLAQVQPGPTSALPRALARVLPLVEPRQSLIVAGLGETDLADGKLMADLDSDQRRRISSAHVVCVSAASSQIDAFLTFDNTEHAQFQPDGTTSAVTR